MNNQDILKIKPASLRSLFRKKILEYSVQRTTADSIIRPYHINDLSHGHLDYNIINIDNYVVRYSNFKQLKTLLWDTKQIVKHGRVNILPDGTREYTVEIVSDEPIIYFWISEHKIFYVGKAGNGWSKRSRGHQNGWDRKAREERIIKNNLLLENIFPEHPAGFNPHHGFAVVTIPVNQLTIESPEQLEALSPFKNAIPPVSVNIIDELEKIFIFICQPQLNKAHKNGDGVNFEILKNILGVAGN